MDKHNYGYTEIEDIAIIQNMLTEMMQEIHLICEENNIIYNLHGGSLLGAIRHKGFIPWDDDIDITMPRDDYEKFISIVKEKYGDKYIIRTYEDKNYIYPFAKFCKKDTVLIETGLKDKYAKINLYIDIFPIEGFPLLKECDIKKSVCYLQMLKKKRCSCVYKATLSKNILKKLYHNIRKLPEWLKCIKGYRYYLNKEVEESIKYQISDCEYVSCAVSWWEHGKMLKKDYFDRDKYKFGQYEFWGIKNYDAILKQMYGDYMKLPPEEKRIATHGYKLFIRGDK